MTNEFTNNGGGPETASTDAFTVSPCLQQHHCSLAYTVIK